MENNTISKRLESSRKDLLDLGLRNAMLNFRPSKRSLTIVDERSEEILRIICQERKSMTFVPVPPNAMQMAIGDGEEGSGTEKMLESEISNIDWGELFQEKEAGIGPAKRHIDTKLQTALTETQLILRLLKIQAAAETYIEEQGVNILYLGLGFLHWFEDDASEKEHKAPLLLIPVNLKRKGARDAFAIEYSGEDLVLNLSLSTKLKSEFSIDLPIDEIDIGPDVSVDGVQSALNDYFKKAAKVIKNNKRWKIVENEIHLGFFSFGKYLMYKDLDETIWPNDRLPSVHPILSRLLGDSFEQEECLYPEDTQIDSINEIENCLVVKDADSSQMLAVAEANKGLNLVIQGPPGTGKSQTITNIIANCIANNKTVLFVSEKMAALEVVKRRLDEVNLGDAVLELHSHKSNKVAVLKELERTLMQCAPASPKNDWELDELKKIKEELNAHCAAVNTRIGGSDYTFVTVLGKKTKLSRLVPNLPIPEFLGAAGWSEKQFIGKLNLVEEYAQFLQSQEKPKDNPFWGCEISDFPPSKEDALIGIFPQLQDTIGQLELLKNDFYAILKMTPASTLNECVEHCFIANRLIDAPSINGATLIATKWISTRSAVEELVKIGETIQNYKQKYKGVLIEAAWDTDIAADFTQLKSYENKWWRIFSPTFRKSHKKAVALYSDNTKLQISQLIAMLQDIIDYQKLFGRFNELAPTGEQLLGKNWQGVTSDWQAIHSLTSWIIRLHEDIRAGSIPTLIYELLDTPTDYTTLKSPTLELSRVLGELRTELAALERTLSFNKVIAGYSIEELPLVELKSKIRHWKENQADIHFIVKLNIYNARLQSEGLSPLSATSFHEAGIAEQLPTLLKISRYRSLLKQAMEDYPILRQFDRVRHETILKRYRSLDKKILDRNQQTIAHSIWNRMPSINQPGQIAIIRQELGKKRKLMPLRQLVDKAGEAIQKIKPVFMMSPMSIATFIPPGKLDFDVVIFDEASQVKAIDAFGAILRGKQVIVVGDNKQMPPTQFFFIDADLDEEDNQTSDVESILNLFRVKGVPERYLRWHYRSRHESLIAVSNIEFYDRRLVVFRSAGTNPNATGIKFHLNPNALFDRGRSRTNREEAKAVARAVMEHAYKRSHLSLGVAAFSLGQRDLIEVELEVMRREDSSVESFFSKEKPEPFFIKNLENVQGDERDFIFISIGYGRNESGKVAKNFGPINNDGGERRLNVLITRAKFGLEVFSNFTAGELDLDVTAKHGVRALKHFLKYAETGELEMPIETGKGADSDFEEEVRYELSKRGYDIEPQVGMAGYFIDMAVRDPECPGRYILAIECDGASYHSSRSARDRDRLRQSVLEGLGWRFHRIWSTDWFHNPQRELERVEQAITSAKQSISVDALTDINKKDDESESKIVRTNLNKTVGFKPDLYKKVTLPKLPSSHPEFHETALSDLVSSIKKVITVEAPVHRKEVLKRLMDRFGISRAGSRVEETMDKAITLGKMQNEFHYEGDFFYHDKQKIANLRSRADCEIALRNIEMVAPEEIDAALLKTIELGISIVETEAIQTACVLLGFGRVTEGMSNTVRKRINKLHAKRRIQIQDDKLTLPD